MIFLFVAWGVALLLFIILTFCTKLPFDEVAFYSLFWYLTPLFLIAKLLFYAAFTFYEWAKEYKETAWLKRIARKSNKDKKKR